MRSVALTRQGFPFALALLAGALLAHGSARGVTLGNVASLSGLDRPLRVVIPVSLSAGETVNAACIKLVADNSPGAPQILTARVNLEQGATNPRLVITTASAVHEPALRLNVQAGCGSTSRRDYVLLLDPPALQSPTMVASADADEPIWLARRADTPSKRPSTNPQPIAVTKSEPDIASRLPNWGTPVATGPVTPSRSMTEAAPKNVDARPAGPVAIAAPPTQLAPREFVNMVGGSGAFIPEASAAPLTPRAAPVTSPTTALRQSTPQSIPLITRPQQPQISPALVLWQQSWQYVAAAAALLFLGLGAFIMRRRVSAASWFTKANRLSLKGETQAGLAPATFAHFGVMTEPVSIKPRVPITQPMLPPQQSAPDPELDSLLVEIQSDMIDEKAIKDAWREAATDAASDIGTASILKAIAAAERDLDIASPDDGGHFEMDTTLEGDPVTLPNLPSKKG